MVHPNFSTTSARLWGGKNPSPTESELRLLQAAPAGFDMVLPSKLIIVHGFTVHKIKSLPWVLPSEMGSLLANDSGFTIQTFGRHRRQNFAMFAGWMLNMSWQNHVHSYIINVCLLADECDYKKKHPCGNGKHITSYHLFMVIWGMAYYCLNHITIDTRGWTFGYPHKKSHQQHGLSHQPIVFSHVKSPFHEDVEINHRFKP